MAENDYCCRKSFVHFSGGQIKTGETQPGIAPRLCTEWSSRQGPEKKTEINCSPQNAMPHTRTFASRGLYRLAITGVKSARLTRGTCSFRAVSGPAKRLAVGKLYVVAIGVTDDAEIAGVGIEKGGAELQQPCILGRGGHCVD